MAETSGYKFEHFAPPFASRMLDAVLACPEHAENHCDRSACQDGELEYVDCSVCGDELSPDEIGGITRGTKPSGHTYLYPTCVACHAEETR